MKVLIIVDRDDPKSRRTCFWKNVEVSLEGLRLEYRSLADARDQSSFLDLNEFQVIVFNWDVLNGDYWFRGEITEGMIDRASRSFLPAWLRRGGLLLLEAQCSHWIPSQHAYEVALKNPVFTTWKYDYYKYTPGTHFRVKNRYREHPFVVSLDSEVEHGFKGVTWNIEDWFPEWLSHECTKYNYIPTRTHSGVFLTWEPVWLPLLVCGQTGNPVLLARTYGKGAVVATTMYLASSGQVDLIKRIFHWRDASPSSTSTAVHAYHKACVWKNYLGRWSLRLSPIVVAVVAAACFRETLAAALALLGLAGAFALGALNSYLRGKVMSMYKLAKASLSTKGVGV